MVGTDHGADLDRVRSVPQLGTCPRTPRSLPVNLDRRRVSREGKATPSRLVRSRVWLGCCRFAEHGNKRDPTSRPSSSCTPCALRARVERLHSGSSRTGRRSRTRRPDGQARPSRVLAASGGPCASAARSPRGATGFGTRSEPVVCGAEEPRNVFVLDEGPEQLAGSLLGLSVALARRRSPDQRHGREEGAHLTSCPTRGPRR